MKFLSYKHDGQATFGAVIGSGVVDLGRRHSELADLREAIRADKLASAAEKSANHAAP